MNIKPFFARFLCTQNTATSTPTTHTLKYPSDNDTFNPNDRGYAVKLRREALPDPGYATKLRKEAVYRSDPGYATKFRPEAVSLSEPQLKDSNTCTPQKPGNVVTLAFPSDSDHLEGRLRF